MPRRMRGPRPLFLFPLVPLALAAMVASARAQAPARGHADAATSDARHDAGAARDATTHATTDATTHATTDATRDVGAREGEVDSGARVAADRAGEGNSATPSEGAHDAPAAAASTPPAPIAADPVAVPATTIADAGSVSAATVDGGHPVNPAASSSAHAPSAGGSVKIHDRVAFTIKVPRAGQSADDRARSAARALEGVASEPEPGETHVETHEGAAVVYVGKTPIVTLGEEDALAQGEPLDVVAASTAARIEEALRAERTRSTIANTVFSFSLLVFSGLIAFFLFRRVGQLADRARKWVKENPERIPALRLRHIEVVRSHSIRGAVGIALGLGHLFAQIAIGYGWLVIALSLFAATRGYTEKLTGFVLAPFWALLGRLGSALPILVLASIAAVALGVLVRFVALFFESVAQGDTVVSWLPRELAQPTSVIARAGIVVVAIVLASPLLTGAEDGALSRVGVAVLVAVGLSSTPVLACAAAGIPIVFGRKLRVGDWVEIGEARGQVMELSIFSVTLEGEDGSELRVPHLAALLRPTRIIGNAPAITLDVTVSAYEAQARVREILLTTASAYATRARVDLVSIDESGARYRITACHLAGTGDLASAIADTLRASNVALGRTTAPSVILGRA